MYINLSVVLSYFLWETLKYDHSYIGCMDKDNKRTTFKYRGFLIKPIYKFKWTVYLEVKSDRRNFDNPRECLKFINAYGRAVIPKLVLDNWRVVERFTNKPYLPPVMSDGVSLSGDAFNHPKFSSGASVNISLVQGKIDDFVVTESGSLYVLGKPNPDYEKQFPDGKKRFMDSLTEIYQGKGC